MGFIVNAAKVKKNWTQREHNCRFFETGRSLKKPNRLFKAG